jgi:hypothetical protein
MLSAMASSNLHCVTSCRSSRFASRYAADGDAGNYGQQDEATTARPPREMLAVTVRVPSCSVVLDKSRSVLLRRGYCLVEFEVDSSMGHFHGHHVLNLSVKHCCLPSEEGVRHLFSCRIYHDSCSQRRGFPMKIASLEQESEAGRGILWPTVR